eukprot:TRINITY_DN2068_c0_g2_i3.p1 TRINITY_DN2068_c0_g2~~TRINITY_DN2068_c0_g2_i3.p1  ORF type:complete len:1529 (+),score=204.90 TRINITY_DN2068_c0_g2_i3:524-4588(+)
MKNKCFDSDGNVYLETERLCGDVLFSRSCPQGRHCQKAYINPNYGFSSFDSVFHGILTLITVTSTDSWTFIMYFVQDAIGIFAVPFFVIFVLLTTFFAISLIFAVIYDQYSTLSEEARKNAPVHEEYNCPTYEEIINWDEFRRKIFVFLHGPHMDKIAWVVLLDVIIQSSNFYTVDNILDTRKYLDYSNIIFVTIYFLVAFMIIFSHRDRGIWRSNDHFIIICVVSIGIADIILSFIVVHDRAIRIVRATRALRVLLIFSQIRKFQDMHNLLATIKRSSSAILPVFSIMGLFLIIFSVLGRDIMAGELGEGTDKPRWNFDNIYRSFLTSFQVVNGDTWTNVLYDTMNFHPIMAIFTVSLWIFGSIILLNFAISVLLDGFSVAPDKLVIDHTTGEVYLIEGEGSSFDNLEIPEEFESKSSSVSSYEKTKDFKKKTISLGRKTIHISQSGEVHADREKIRVCIGKTLGLFERTNPIRQFCWNLVNHRWFDPIIAIIIFFNCLTLAADGPGLNNLAASAWFLRRVEEAFSIIYVIEFLVKLIAWGFRAYFKNAWDIIDFIVVLVSAFSLFFPNNNSVASLIALRALRLLFRFQQPKMVLHSFIITIPAMGTVSLFVLLIWLSFSVAGVNLFGGLFYRCNDADVSTKFDCVGTFSQDGMTNISRTWENAPVHFDNVFMGLLSLFQVAAGVGAIDVMYNGIDVTGTNLNPVRNSRPENALYFIVFILVGSFFCMNLFIGAVIDNFSRIKMRVSGRAFLTNKQRQWLSAYNILRVIKFEKQLNFSGMRFLLAEFNSPNTLNQCIVGLNLLVFSLYHDGMSNEMHYNLYIINAIFLGIYTIQEICYIIAFRWEYFTGKYTWSQYNMFFIIISWIALLITPGVENWFVHTTYALRVFRIFYVSKKMRNILSTFLTSFDSIVSLALLYIVIYFIYAVMGVKYMGDLEFQTKYGISEQANFQNFLFASLTLFRLTTKDTWPPLMYESIYVCDGSENCENDYLAIIYYISFILLSSYILFSMLSGVLIDRFEEILSGDYLRDNHFRQFLELWEIEDTPGNKLKADRVIDLLKQLSPEMGGIHPGLTGRQIMEELHKMNIYLTKSGSVKYHHLIRALVAKVLQVDLNNIILDEEGAMMTDFTLAQYYASELITKIVKRDTNEINFKIQKLKQNLNFRILDTIQNHVYKVDVKKRKKQTKKTLAMKDILEDPYSLRAFQSYISGIEKNKLNLMFYYSVTELTNDLLDLTESQVQVELDEIYQKYVLSRAVSCKRKVIRELDKAFSSTKKKEITIFEEAVEQVVNHLTANYYQSFLRSKSFRDYSIMVIKRWFIVSKKHKQLKEKYSTLKTKYYENKYLLNMYEDPIL